MIRNANCGISFPHSSRPPRWCHADGIRKVLRFSGSMLHCHGRKSRRVHVLVYLRAQDEISRFPPSTSNSGHQCQLNTRYVEAVHQLQLFKFAPTPNINDSVGITSPVSSQGPICRICHDGDSKEELVAPCRCSGTMALVHQTCIETWLNSANVESCEICKYVFVTSKELRPYHEWFKQPSNPADLRNLVGDLFCFVLLSPLAAISAYLCVVGGAHYMKWTKQWEAVGLFFLAVFLASLYVLWCSVTVRYHMNVLTEWRRTHQKVKLAALKRSPSSIYMLQTFRSDSNNNSSHHYISNLISTPGQFSIHRSQCSPNGYELQRIPTANSPAIHVVRALPAHMQAQVLQTDSRTPRTDVVVHTIVRTENLPETVV